MSQSPLDIGPRFAQKIKDNVPQNKHTASDLKNDLIDANSGQLDKEAQSTDDRAKTLWKTKVITSN